MAGFQGHIVYPGPIGQKDRTNTAIKMILDSKGAGFATRAIQSALTHINSCLERD